MEMCEKKNMNKVQNFKWSRKNEKKNLKNSVSILSWTLPQSHSLDVLRVWNYTFAFIMIFFCCWMNTIFCDEAKEKVGVRVKRARLEEESIAHQLIEITIFSFHFIDKITAMNVAN